MRNGFASRETRFPRNGLNFATIAKFASRSALKRAHRATAPPFPDGPRREFENLPYATGSSGMPTCWKSLEAGPLRSPTGSLRGASCGPSWTGGWGSTAALRSLRTGGERSLNGSVHGLRPRENPSPTSTVLHQLHRPRYRAGRRRNPGEERVSRDPSETGLLRAPADQQRVLTTSPRGWARKTSILCGKSSKQEWRLSSLPPAAA